MELEPPKWLNELEERLEHLKKHKLQHEVGSGAACLKCHDKCPGLELHFWRKICIECKCSVNDHYTEESSDALKFEILTFKKDAKRATKSFPKILNVLADRNAGNVILQKVPSANTETREVEFDWVPDVPSEMALEYMASLPSEKLPIKDTTGGLQRKQLWKTQIPLTDIAPDNMAVMDNQEKLRFQNFLENLRNEVVGQGRVQRIHLKPFVASSSFCKGLQEPQSTKKLEKINSTKSEEAQFAEPCLKLPSFFYNKKLDEEKDKRKLLPGAGHLVNPFQRETATEYTGLPNVGFMSQPSVESTHEPYAQSLNENEQNVLSSGKNQPGHGGISSHLPELEETKELSDDNANKLENLQLEDAENNNEVVVDKAVPCVQCEETIGSGSVVVTTEHGGVNEAWHPQCFVCTVCEELLVDLMYFYLNGKVYCLRHYAAEKKIERCNACDELIFSDTFTMTLVNQKVYHVHHFCCFECDVELGGQQYVEVGDQPVCLPCYSRVYAMVCKACEKPLEAAEQRVSYKDSHWHALPQCFCCSMCRKSLLNQRCLFKDNLPFCSSNCFQDFYNLIKGEN